MICQQMLARHTHQVMTRYIARCEFQKLYLYIFMLSNYINDLKLILMFSILCQMILIYRRIRRIWIWGTFLTMLTSRIQRTSEMQLKKQKQN